MTKTRRRALAIRAALLALSVLLNAATVSADDLLFVDGKNAGKDTRSSLLSLSSSTGQPYGRRLEDGSGNAYFEYDLKDFSLRFDRCQYIKMFDGQVEDGEDQYDPFAVRHFVVFRLCPSNQCSECSSTVPHGQYVMEAEEYLQYTAAEQAQQFEYMCASCEEECDEYGGSCSGCGRQCYLQQNLAASGYVDAANYLACQQVNIQNFYYDDDGAAADNQDEADNQDGGDDDGYQLQLYIGPRCSSSGNRILLGLFWDQYCLKPYTEITPEEVLGYNISYSMLQHTLSTDGTNCLSCEEQADDNNANDEADADYVNEMCEVVYADAAKCESIYGIDAFVQSNRADGNQENQVENEFMVCSWIESLLLDSYTETGDINLQGDQLTIYRDVTPLQKTAFSLLVLSVVSLVAAAFFIQRQIERSLPKVDLSCQSDAIIT